MVDEGADGRLTKKRYFYEKNMTESRGADFGQRTVTDTG